MKAAAMIAGHTLAERYESFVYSTQYSYSTKCEQGQRQLPDMLFNLF